MLESEGSFFYVDGVSVSPIVIRHTRNWSLCIYMWNKTLRLTRSLFISRNSTALSFCCCRIDDDTYLIGKLSLYFYFWQSIINSSDWLFITHQDTPKLPDTSLFYNFKTGYGNISFCNVGKCKLLVFNYPPPPTSLTSPRFIRN